MDYEFYNKVFYFVHHQNIQFLDNFYLKLNITYYLYLDIDWDWDWNAYLTVTATVIRDKDDCPHENQEQFPAVDAMPITSHRDKRWIEEIANIDLYNTIKSFNDNYIEIISMKMDGITDAKIAATLGCERSTVTHKIALIKNILKNFYSDTTF